MKTLNFYQQTYCVSSPDHVFRILLENLKPSNMLWSYFVNWEKIFDQVKPMEWHLSLLNCLIGKPNFDQELKKLLDAHPSVLSVVPQLAVRIAKKQEDLQRFTILVNYADRRLEFADYDFSSYNPEHLPQYLEFLEKTGIKELLVDSKIKNLIDYMIGVEAGLDSNARKNRSGKSMELICETFIRDWCSVKGYKYLPQATVENAAESFGHSVPAELRGSKRKYDFAVNASERLTLFEVNFYNGGGSKLDKTAYDYESQHLKLKKAGIGFIWVTDGPGWKKTSQPLSQAFRAMDYLFSLDMLEKGILPAEF